VGKKQLVLNLFDGRINGQRVMSSFSLSNLKRCRGDCVIICTSLVFVYLISAFRLKLARSSKTHCIFLKPTFFFLSLPIVSCKR